MASKIWNWKNSEILWIFALEFFRRNLSTFWKNTNLMQNRISWFKCHVIVLDFAIMKEKFQKLIKFLFFSQCDLSTIWKNNTLMTNLISWMNGHVIIFGPCCYGKHNICKIVLVEHFQFFILFSLLQILI